MSNELDRVVRTAVETQEKSIGLMEQLIAVARPGSVYSEPVRSDEYTVITASEVMVGMGFGFGMGGGTAPESNEGEATHHARSVTNEENAAGAGGGGGGYSMGRPVAVVSIGPRGVQVEPVPDATKIVLAFFTMLGSMLLMFSRMRKASRS